MSLFKSRWWQVVAGISMNLAFGNVYGWSIFVVPLEKQFGWKRADTSMVFSIAIAMTGFTFLLSGWIYDRWGPSFSAFTGGVLASTGFFLSAYTHSLAYLYICFGVLGGFGSGLGCAVIIAVVSKWFPDKRGLALGLIVGAYGAASAIFAPLAGQILIPKFGLAATFKVLGSIFLGMTMIGALLLRNPPRGFSPGKGTHGPARNNSSLARECSPTEVLRTPTFYVMWFGYALGCASGMMVISQLVPFASSRGVKTASLATMGLVVGAAANTLGRVLSGWMSDTFGRINVLRLVTGISSVAMPLLYAAGAHLGLLFAAVAVVYYCYGTLLSVNAAACSDFWGVRNVGINHGMLFTAWGVAGIIGPRIGGVLYDRYHNYLAAFCTAGLLAALALVFELFAQHNAIPQGARSHAMS
jgi:OFA family oxalate/formate antiporter-like MFS transporter